MNRFIDLTHGMRAIVDAEDYDRLVAVGSWHAKKSRTGQMYYACRSGYLGSGFLLMHREVLQAKAGVLIDHVNGNGLDNRKENLRAATRSQNGCNRGKNLNNTSGFKGVFWHKSTGKWYAAVRLNRKLHHLGLFETREEANEVACSFRSQAHGAFARDK